jgi:ribose transport system permease protein
MTQKNEESISDTAIHAVLDELEEGPEEVQPVVSAPPSGFAGLLAALLRIREISVLGAALILFVGLSVATPLFFQLDNLLLVARQISIVTIIAIGMTFLFISREIDLSVGSLYGFLVVFLATLIAEVGLNPWLAMLITVIIGGCIGLFNGLVTTRIGIPSFIITLGMLSILRGAALLLSGGWPILIKLPAEHSFLNITAGQVGDVVPTQILWMVGLLLIAGFILGKTRFGAHVYATGGNEEAAMFTGIPTKRVKTLCFVMTGALCGIAAALLLGQVKSGFPLTGQGHELDVIAAVVIGGTPLFGGAGSILGTLLGAAITGMITNGLVLLGASAYFEPVAKGSIIVIAVVVDTYIRRKRAA